MIEEGIHDGDVVIVDKNQPPKNGSVVVAFIDNEWTVKYFFDEEIGNPTTITINKNLVCPPHKDKYNKSSSVIFSIGDYEGCNLIIQKPDGDEEINTFRNPVMFEGSKYTHYNTPLISGTKYSFIFFSVCLPEAFII